MRRRRRASGRVSALAAVGLIVMAQSANGALLFPERRFHFTIDAHKALFLRFKCFQLLGRQGVQLVEDGVRLGGELVVSCASSFGDGWSSLTSVLLMGMRGGGDWVPGRGILGSMRWPISSRS